MEFYSMFRTIQKFWWLRLRVLPRIFRPRRSRRTCTNAPLWNITLTSMALSLFVLSEETPVRPRICPSSRIHKSRICEDNNTDLRTEWWDGVEKVAVWSYFHNGWCPLYLFQIFLFERWKVSVGFIPTPPDFREQRYCSHLGRTYLSIVYSPARFLAVKISIFPPVLNLRYKFSLVRCITEGSWAQHAPVQAPRLTYCWTKVDVAQMTGV